jgi:DNA-binding CsgD family transcriptional regulator
MDDSRFNGQDVANLRAIQLSLGAVIRRGFATDKNDTQTDSVEAVLAAHALSMREADVMRSVLAGRSAEEIAETFGVSVETIKTQRKRAYAKLGVSSKTELFAKLLSGRALAKAG